MARTFIEHVRSVVASVGVERSFTFLEDTRGTGFSRLTFAEVDAAARARAGLLAERTEPGARVLLLYPPGLEFLLSFLGCVYSGRVGVPVPVPQDERGVAHVFRVIDDASVSLVLTESRLFGVVSSLLAEAGRGGLGHVATDTDEAQLPDPEAWRMPDVDSDTTVLAQYTSGSTSAPKGVLVGHRQLLGNAAATMTAFGLGARERLVAWLPHYHDMGLMGTLLQPLFGAIDTTLMSPLTFLKRPYRWLEVASSVQATLLVAPDFAYELAARRVTDAQLAQLDLSSLRVVMNGAEPIRAQTLRAFSERFAPAGFRPEAFAPCYGMAETTLLATAAPPQVRWREVAVDAAALERDEIEPSERADAVTLVSSGRPMGVEVLVVDPATRQPLTERRVGEIWLRGGHVAAGYLGAPAATAETFGGMTTDGRGPCLRTGDLGFLIDGELVVTGRLKEVVVVNGRNIYPQDIEQSVRDVHPALAASVSAAFAVDRTERGGQPTRDHVVVIQEVRPDQLKVPMPEFAAAIRAHVARSFEIAAPTVVLVQRGVIQRTTSGKIRRRAMRDAYLAGRLRHLHVEPALVTSASVEVAAASVGSAQVGSVPVGSAQVEPTRSDPAYSEPVQG